LKEKQADIILMDISMPEMDGIEATETATKKFPGIKIIGLSSYEDQIYYYKMIKAGALGFVTKKAGIEELETAIKNVYKGENYFSQNLLRNILYNVSNIGEESLVNSSVKISKREKEILILICKGYSNKEISEELFISHRTVDKHRTNLLSKTVTKNSANLVMFAIKNKLVEL
ncbi:MAG: response regulator transcription factor, partial [Chlorobi bacterium]|nr:response regulator transcription factor [Chlorobiota bacterium]